MKCPILPNTAYVLLTSHLYQEIQVESFGFTLDLIEWTSHLNTNTWHLQWNDTLC